MTYSLKYTDLMNIFSHGTGIFFYYTEIICMFSDSKKKLFWSV